MKIQVNAAGGLALDRRRANRMVALLQSELARFGGTLTRAELHLRETIEAGRPAIEATLEVRPANAKPRSVRAIAPRASVAVIRTARKMVGRLQSRRSRLRSIARRRRPE